MIRALSQQINGVATTLNQASVNEYLPELGDADGGVQVAEIELSQMQARPLAQFTA